MALHKTLIFEDWVAQFTDNGMQMDVTLTQILTGIKYAGSSPSIGMPVAAVEAYNSGVMFHTPNIQLTFVSPAGAIICTPVQPTASLDERLRILFLKMEQVERSSVPAGTVQVFAGVHAPPGWLICDGRTIGNWDSNANFADNSSPSLFVLLHRSFTDQELPILHQNGTPSQRGHDAEADYNHKMRIQLPDLRGRTIVGHGQGEHWMTPRVMGAKGGAERVWLSENELPSHTHSLGEENFGIRAYGGGRNDNDKGWLLTKTQFLNSAAQAKIQHTGGNAGHENMPPFCVLNYIIKL